MVLNALQNITVQVVYISKSSEISKDRAVQRCGNRGRPVDGNTSAANRQQGFDILDDSQKQIKGGNGNRADMRMRGRNKLIHMSGIGVWHSNIEIVVGLNPKKTKLSEKARDKMKV